VIDTTLNQVFAGSLWRDVTSAIPGATSVYLSSDMLVVVLVAAQATDAADRFPELQQNIKMFRETADAPQDAYLLLVIPQLDEEGYAVIRQALDNTLVCRKILVPLDNHSLGDSVIRHFPLVAPAMAVVPDERPYQPASDGPDDDDLDLLDRTSPANIALHLIEQSLARVRSNE
jgi:hypothetical protein